MPPPQEPAGWTPIQDTKAAAEWAVFIAQVLAAPLLPILRHSFGRRFFGIPGAIALMVLPMWPIFWPEENPAPILALWIAFIVMQAKARIQQLRMTLRGDQTHSRYNGAPRLAWILRRMGERRIKSVAEPLVVLVTGLMVHPDSPPLGGYLIAAAVSLWLTDAVIGLRERTQARDLHDAWIDQQHLAQRVRAMQAGQRGW